MTTPNSDPFLCDDCQSLGYCIKNSGSQHDLFEQTKQLFDNAPDYNVLRKLNNALPVRTTILNKQSVLAKQMQYAHDCYWQQDYETAFLNYKALISDVYNHWEAHLGLTLCAFYLGEYEDSLRYAGQIEIIAYSGWEDALIAFSVVCGAKRKHQEGTTQAPNEIGKCNIRYDIPVKV